MICIRCKGHGWVDGSDEDYYRHGVTTIECPVCKGSGEEDYGSEEES